MWLQARHRNLSSALVSGTWMFWPHFGQQLFGIAQLFQLGMSSVLQERQQLLNTHITPILPLPHHRRGSHSSHRYLDLLLAFITMRHV